MKNYVRLCLVLILTVALPLVGAAPIMANVQAPAHPADALSDAATVDSSNSLEKCDIQNDATTACENGEECKTSSLLQLTLGNVAVPAFSPRPSVSLSGQIPAQIPDVVWHPPRS